MNSVIFESKKLFIEVKSIYWYNRQKQLNDAKKQACIVKGYDFVFWIFDQKGKLITEF